MAAITSKEKSQLIETTLSQAKYFLNEADEFFPFATVIDKNNAVKPTGIYFGEENPSSETVLQLLEEAIQKGILNGNYRAGAIGIDIFITTSEDIQKTGIEVRLYFDHSLEKKYFSYFKTETEYHFKEEHGI
jgi:hypothetical protein